MRSPVNASTRASRRAPHDSGSVWIATPSPCRTFTNYSLPVSRRTENFFSKMTRQRIRRGVFRSIADLQAAITTYLAEHNANPKPFVRTKSADTILAKLDRLPVSSECA
jgi:hypothetical protein